MKKVLSILLLLFLFVTVSAQGNPSEDKQQIAKAKSEAVKRLNTTSSVLDSLSNFIRNTKFQKIIYSLYDDPKGREEAEKDFASYLEKRGVNVPSHYQLTLIDHNWRIKFSIEFLGIKVSVDFDSESKKK